MNNIISKLLELSLSSHTVAIDSFCHHTHLSVQTHMLLFLLRTLGPEPRIKPG